MSLFPNPFADWVQYWAELVAWVKILIQVIIAVAVFAVVIFAYKSLSASAAQAKIARLASEQNEIEKAKLLHEVSKE